MDTAKLNEYEKKLAYARKLQYWIKTTEKALVDGLTYVSVYDYKNRYTLVLSTDQSKDDVIWTETEADRIEREIFRVTADSLLRRRLERARKMLEELKFDNEGKAQL